MRLKQTPRILPRLAHETSSAWTLRVGRVAAGLQLAAGASLLFAAFGDDLGRLGLIYAGLGASGIVNGAAVLLGVPPSNLYLTLASLACFLLGALGAFAGYPN